MKVEELTEDQKRRLTVYEKAGNILNEEGGISDELSQETDCLVYITYFGKKESTDYLNDVKVAGTYASLTKMFNTLVNEDSFPVELEGALMETAINILAKNQFMQGDMKAPILGMNLRRYVDEKYGGVECDCDNCKAERERARKRASSDKNVN